MPSTHNRRGVTIVTRLHPPHIDAAGQYAEQLAEGLASRGWSRRGGLVWKILTSANAWSVPALAGGGDTDGDHGQDGVLPDRPAQRLGH